MNFSAIKLELTAFSFLAAIFILGALLLGSPASLVASLVQLLSLILIVRVPLLLHKIGFYKKLNEAHPFTRKIAETLGSKEPSVFYKNVFQVVFFIFLFSLFFTDFNTKAQLANAFTPQIYESQACLVKQQVPIIACVDPDKYSHEYQVNYASGRSPYSNKTNFTLSDISAWNKTILRQEIKALDNKTLGINATGDWGEKCVRGSLDGVCLDA